MSKHIILHIILSTTTRDRYLYLGMVIVMFHCDRGTEVDNTKSEVNWSCHDQVPNWPQTFVAHRYTFNHEQACDIPWSPEGYTRRVINFTTTMWPHFSKSREHRTSRRCPHRIFCFHVEIHPKPIPKPIQKRLFSTVLKEPKRFFPRHYPRFPQIPCWHRERFRWRSVHHWVNQDFQRLL